MLCCTNKLTYAFECGIRLISRSEGPAVNRPGREAGIQFSKAMSTEGAAQNATSAKLVFHKLIP